ncbi:MAG: SLC13 family permease [Anaerolineae bacterium]|nr:SLC13 family permease [Anaerolineae bacterium]
MTLEMGIVLAILIAAIILFVTELIRVDVVALGVVVLLMVSGVLTTEEALSGFSNPAVLTIAGLFVVGGAVLQTGLAGIIGRRILAVAGTDERRLTVVLMAAVALLSGFMSDTGTVAVLLPAIIILARSADLAPSRLLIPLAFGSLLGGASTLIGTPPNIIVSDLLRSEGLQPFSFFSFTPMGLVLLVVGITYMLFAGRRLLPDRRVRLEGQRIESPEELIDRYRLPQNMFRLRVRRTSPLVGETLASVGFGEHYNVTVLGILRRVEPRARFRLAGVGAQRRNGARTAGPDRRSVEVDAAAVLQVDDLLVVQGDGNDVGYLAASWNLGVQRAMPEDEEALIDEEAGVAELILPSRSALLGHSLVDLRFGQQYGLTVLDVQRPGEPDDGARPDFKERELQFGDTLLVQGPWKNIIALKEKRRDFIVTGQPEAMLAAPNRSKAGIAFAILATMIVLMVLDLFPIATLALLAALAMVLTRCLTMDEAYEAINWQSVVLVAGMLPMSIALQNVGLVDVAAQALVGTLGTIAPQAVVAGLFLLTSLFTQVLSNTATTVVIAPIALAAARDLGIQPHAFLMAVAIAASMAFASPVASPVNTLVMGAGNYRFGDYARVGLPLIFLMLLASVLVLPLLFPF